MAGVIKNKKKLFDEEPAMKPQAKRLYIKEADGGFIVGDEYGDGKQKVAKTLAALVKCVKEHFGDASSKEDDSTEDD